MASSIGPQRVEVLRRLVRGAIGVVWMAVPAVAQTTLWFESFGTDGQDAVLASTTDGEGGLVIAALAARYATVGVTGFGSGRGDVLLARYDASGRALWSTRYGTPEARDEPCAVVFDGMDGVFVVGRSYGGPSATGAGLPPRWLSHFDGQGVLTWESTLQPQFLPTAGAANGTGGLLVCGMTFGASNSFVASYDASGAVLWSTTVPILANNWDMATAVATDGAGGAYLCGLSDEVFISYDAWLARVDGSGSLLWVRQFVTPEHDYAYALTEDGNGGVYVGGSTAGSLAGPANGSGDMWIARYDAAGNQSWIRQYGTFQAEGIRALTRPESSGVLVAARNSGKVFLGRFDLDGNLIYLAPVGVSADSSSNETIVSDGLGATYLAGGTEGSSLPHDWSDIWIAGMDGSCNSGTTYCTASTTSIPGCQAAISGSGSPTLSDPTAWTASSGPIPGGNIGLLLFGASGKDSTPYGTLGGILCVASPTNRTAPKLGGGDMELCNGSYAFTLGDLIAAAPIVTSGATINAQVWARDPANQDGFLLSDGIEFTVCP